MKTATAVLSALALTHQATAVVDKWTPADFNWDAHTQSRFGVATQNVTANPPTKDLVIHANVVQNTNESDLIIHENFPIAITLGATLRAVSWLASAASLASTAVGCWEYLTAEAKEEETTAASRSSCVLGLASSVLGFGVSGASRYLANKADAIAAARAAALPPQLPPVDLGDSFREAMELTTFGKVKRDLQRRHIAGRGLSTLEENMQFWHDDFTASMIRDAKLGEGEFLGYADDKHPLSKRDGVHALAPRFAFEHPTRGSMVLSTRFTNETTHITVEPHIIGNPKVHKRYQEEYQAEVLDNKRVLEGRFDHSATQADPGNPEIDAAEMFGTAEDTLHCLVSDDGFTLNNLIDVQFYDDSNRATFGYASIGVFDDTSPEGDLYDTQPQPPVTGAENC